MQVSKAKKGYKLVDVRFGKAEEIPEDWSIEDFKNIVFFQEGPGLRNWQFRKSGMKVINVRNLKNGKLDLSNTERFISMNDFKKYLRFAIDEKDVVVASSGATYGKVAKISKEDLPLMLNTSVIRFHPKNKELDYDFLRYFLESQNFKKQIDILITGAAQPNFGPYHLNKLKIAKPIFKEQQKIALILSNVDNTIDKTNQLIQKTKLIKKGLMQKLFTKGIGHTKFKKVDWIYDKKIEIPEDWVELKIKDCVKIIDYRGRTPPFSDSGIMHIRSNNVRNMKMKFDNIVYVSEKTYDDYMVRGIPKENDVLFTTEGPLGEVALVPKNLKFSLAQRIIILRTDTKKILPHFLQYSLTSYNTKKQLGRLTTGSTLGGISSKGFKSIRLIIPKIIDEQKQIATILSNIDSQINKEKLQKSNLEILKKGLMQKLLTGQIRVRV